VAAVAELGSLGAFNRMSLSKLSQKELQLRCSWCHCLIPEDQECFGAGARVRPEAKHLIGEHEGRFMTMRLSGDREVIVMIPTAESDARRAGDDIYFQACSEDCCDAITKAIRRELSDGA